MSQPRSFHTTLIYVAFALVVVAVISLHSYQIRGREYREDEAWWVHAMLHRSLHEQLLWTANDVHPPLSLVSFGVWFDLFGHHEVIARFLNKLVICLGLALTFRLAADLFDRRAGLLAAFLLGIIPLYIFYGNEMRPYGFIVTAVVAVQWVFLRWLWRPSFRWSLAFVLVGMLAVYTHNYGILVLLALFLYMLLFVRWNWRLHLYAFGLFSAVALSLVGWALPMAQGLLVTYPGGSIVGMTLDTGYSRALVWDWLQMSEPSVGQLLLLIGLLIPEKRVFPAARRQHEARFRFGDAWRRGYAAAVPLGVILLIVLINPVIKILMPRYLVAILPPIAILAAYGARALPWQAAFGALLLLTLPAVGSFRIYQETGTYLDAVAFMDETDLPGSRLVIDGRGVVATMPLYYYLSERGVHLKNSDDVFILTGLRDRDVGFMAQSPAAIARAASAANLRVFEDFLEPAAQVWYATLDGHQTSFGAPFLDILNREYVIHRSHLFEFQRGRRPVYIADYRRIPDDLTDMFLIGESIHLQQWTLLNDVNAQRCQSITLESWWQIDAPLDDNYAMTLTLADSGGVGVARADDTPAGTLTLQWEINRPYLDLRSLTIPCDLAAGDYPLLLGWYDSDNAESLPASLPDGAPLGGLIYLTTLHVAP